MQSIDVLGENGLLSQSLPGYSVREPQLRMAEAIEQSLQHQTELIIEAGTGTGKTFGYLVPLFLSQKKSIISTGTKNLQDQLFFKDIPVIKKLLASTLKVVLLKGRANYLCQQRLEKTRLDGRFVSRQQVRELHQIKEWSLSTQSGDIAEIDTVPEDSSIWPYVTSTADNCLNQECPFYKECYVMQARQQALSADMVVVNHHLFFADMVLQDEGFGELLPGADAIVFDEAHHIPDVASLFFSTVLTSRQLIELARDSEAESLELSNDIKELVDEAAKLQNDTQAMRAAFGKETRRAPWMADQLSSELRTCINNIKHTLIRLEEILKEAAVRSKGMENCWKRAIQLIERFNLLTGTTPQDKIHWFELHLHSFALQFTPMVIADQFQRVIQEKQRTWIFTSATLTVGESFELFSTTLGLQHATKLKLKSPFDYQRQALLYVPRGLPDTRAELYTESVVDAALPVIEAAGGRTFLLFTSYRAMELAASYIRDKLTYPMLIQGTQPKRELIEQFKKLGNAVLLGTSSFWYGVDVRGEALSCVIIDKLPFASPDDPILQARITALRKQGMDPFQTHQLPHAILTLKQGAGRLIRDDTDRGILMICDPRIVGNRYGKVFLQSLPDMPRTRDLGNVREFLMTSDE